ncbi:hypothetical protein Tco_0350057, partial [Tanacetum coccineum]
MCLALRSQSRHHLHLSMYHLFRSLFTRRYIPESDPEEDPEEDDKEDPEEDLADYSADRGDDDDDAEEEHLDPADPAAVAYSADQDPYLAYRVMAR